MAVRDIPEEIKALVDAWHKYFHRWRFAHYVLGILGTVSSITVASNPKILASVPYSLDTLAWLSAVCIALITFLIPSKKAKSYVSAWRILYDAVGRYKHDPQVPTATLFDAVASGEKLIDGADI